MFGYPWRCSMSARTWFRLSLAAPRDGISLALKDYVIETDVCNLRAKDIEQLIDALDDLEAHIQDSSNSVRVYCE